MTKIRLSSGAELIILETEEELDLAITNAVHGFITVHIEGDGEEKIRESDIIGISQS